MVCSSLSRLYVVRLILEILLGLLSQDELERSLLDNISACTNSMMIFSISYQSNSEYLRVPTLRGRALLIWKALRE